ncbi:MAG TPA: sigma-70 family RNA polymerase sigma factor, partial [Solirubrobacterales bacterium]|nr:sigma-70 family RNA polymerase sigma factor [Solirubrobacterales bacterium]
PPGTAAIDSGGEESVALQDLLRGERTRMLKHQLASWHPKASPEEIEDALQTSCKRFLEHAQGISQPGQIYTWLRTTASRVLTREAELRHRLVGTDPVVGGSVSLIPDEEADPAKSLIGLEDDADLELLVREVSDALPERDREILALHGAGLKRSQIAERLGISNRAVKKSLEAIMAEARTAVAKLSGGGCPQGEPLVLRSACGLATPPEEAQAHQHIASCGRCNDFLDKLLAWRDKAGAVLPAPAAAEGTNPGVLERAVHKLSDGVGSVRQHIVDGGAQLKQHATSASTRALDPTPLAAARPGTAVAVVAGCIAIGTGAGYCVQQGVDPLGAATGLVAPASEEEPTEAANPPSAAEPTVPTYTPEAPVEEPAPEPEPSPQPAAESQPQPEEKTAAKPDPVPEDTFEPSSPPTTSETEPEASYEATEESAPPSSEPAPAQTASSPAGQFQP